VKVVCDTNVFVSAVYFGGTPGKVLDMWRDGKIELLLTADILAEYEEVIKRLQERYQSVDPDPVIHLVVRRGTFVEPAVLDDIVCADRNDDQFVAAALGGGARMIVSGDAHLRAVSGYRGIEVLTPAQFVKRHGKEETRGDHS